ncbi:MAG: ABC-type transport auxiliary lipoprotein family protein [Succinivibrionaceae bacterium]|nr:ABC-type transport auxiliary lipoprotein family protein [Succinivibrionaceae bacterium]
MGTCKMSALACALGLMVAGCGSDINPERYSMVQGVKAASLVQGAGVSVELSPVLDEGGIVLQVSRNSLIGAKHHRWAEPLEMQLRILCSEALGRSGRSLRGGRLGIVVSRFQGSESGQAYISAVFTRYDKRGRERGTVGLDRELTQQGEGYTMLVDTLREGFSRMCDEAIGQLW